MARRMNTARWVIGAALVWLLGAGSPAPGQAAPQAAPSAVLATVEGWPVTEADIEARFRGQMLRLRNQVYSVKRRAVDTLIDERLVAAEADKRGLSRRELLQQEVTDKAGTVTEEDIEAFYEANAEDEPGLFTHHPPGLLYLIGVAFRCLGDAFWVEKALSLGWMLAAAAALAGLARAAGVNAAWTLFVFFALPSTIGTLANHYLDGPLALAMIGAVAAARRAALAPSPPRALTAAAAAGLMAAAGFWIKGPVALFALIAGPIFTLCAAPIADKRTWRRAFATGAVGAAAFAALVAIPIACSSDAQEWARAYLWQKIVPSIDGSRPAAQGRAWQFAQILLHAGLAAFAAGLAWLLTRLGRRGARRSPRRALADAARAKAALPWLTIAAVGMLPMLASDRQFEHYLLPALPLLALAVAHAASPPLPRWPLRPLAVALLLLAVAVAVGRFGHVARHRSYMDDAAAVARAIAPRRSVGFCADAEPRDRLSAYLFRDHDVLTRLDSDAAHAICHAPLEGHRAALRLQGGATLWERLRDGAEVHRPPSSTGRAKQTAAPPRSPSPMVKRPP